MKIRIKGNTIRLRLGQSEVAWLADNGVLEETTQFADNSFIYKLVRSSEHDKIFADFINGTVSVYLPEKICNEFTSTQQIGCEGEMEISGNKILYILVEKDFKCLDNTFEDQSDNYPNPLAEQYGKQE
jgi:hypothetical protein